MLTMLAVVFSGGRQAEALNIIANGSFESGDFTGWGTKDIGTPFFPLAVRGAGESPSGGAFGLFPTAPTDGLFVASHGFDGSGPDTIEIFQDVMIPANSPALLTFDYTAGWDFSLGNPNNARLLDIDIQSPVSGLSLLKTNILTADPNVVPTLLDTGPLSASLDLSSFAGSSIRINFLSTIPDIFSGPGHLQIDNVVLDVNPVPEPSTMLLLGSGLAGLGFFRRRRKSEI
jgi:hypothetical protein